MNRLLATLATGAFVGAGLFWLVTAPQPLQASDLPDHDPDLANGAYVFHLAGCASCHAAKGAKGAEALRLGGGQAFDTPFGIYHAPNISPDPDTGIGTWTALELINAVTRGVSPDGRHYYPVFPYPSYSRIRLEDAIDLAAYLKTLPAVKQDSYGHGIPFLFSIRRAVGLWKLLFIERGPIGALTETSAEIARGAYIVEGPGHCGECHTPRNWFGGIVKSRWLAGAKIVDGDGRTPDITPHADALGAWSASDIAFYLEAGFKPDGDVAGGAMADVVVNTGQLSTADRAAIAAYLKALAPIAPEPQPAKAP